MLLFIAMWGMVSCGTENSLKEHNALKYGKEVYTCPMPEDSVFSATPGACPKCGMKLIKMANEKEKEVRATYRCPMFCDSLSFDAPGTCPVCGMDLEKVEENAGLESHAHQKKVYTCPMHPEIIRDAPGECPICGMELVAKVDAPGETTGKGGAGLPSVNNSVSASLKTVQPEEKSLPQTVEAFGYITYNPKNAVSISARYAGRIEKLYVKYNFQYVKKGQKIVDIYSPELLTAQENLVLLLNTDPTNALLIESSKKQLRLLGMPDEQVEELARTKKTWRTTSVYAEASGHLHEMQGGNELTMPNMQMGAQSAEKEAKDISSQGFSIREGMYLEKGQTIFSIVSTEKLWAILKIYPEDVAKVRLHQAVSLTSEMHPGKTYQGQIDFLEPAYDPESKHLSARVYLDHRNHHELKIGSLIKGHIIIPATRKGLWVPKQAVLDLGGFEQAVFRKENGTFIARKVAVGNRVGNLVEITQGLDKGDEIASDVQYLIDSEEFVSLIQ